jgi:hypothetical protein
MGISGGPNIVEDGLVLSLDAADRNSYPGSGTTWIDVSGNNNSGSLINGPTYSSTNGGNLVFDGVDDYVSVSKQAALVNASQFTMCAWMKRANVSSKIIIYQGASLNDDVSFELWDDGNVYFEVGNASNGYGYVANTSVNWQQLVMVFDGTQSSNSTRLKAFINSAPQNLLYGVNIPSSSGPSNSVLSIGNSQGLGGGNFSTGNIASVQIYNRALSVTEVLQNYNAQKSRFNL